MASHMGYSIIGYNGGEVFACGYVSSNNSLSLLGPYLDSVTCNIFRQGCCRAFVSLTRSLFAVADLLLCGVDMLVQEPLPCANRTPHIRPMHQPVLLFACRNEGFPVPSIVSGSGVQT